MWAHEQQWCSNMLAWSRLSIAWWRKRMRNGKVLKNRTGQSCMSQNTSWLLLKLNFQLNDRERSTEKKKLESEQPKWVFLSSDDNTLPPLLCNLSSSSCSSERNKKGMCLLIWKRNDWNSVQYSIRLSTQPNAQPKGYSEKQNIKYNWSWVHRSRCSISCMTKCAQTWPHSFKKNSFWPSSHQ